MGLTNDKKCTNCNGSGTCPGCNGKGCGSCNKTHTVAGGWGGTGGDGLCKPCKGTGKVK